tara:strand:+ start:325 stop:480 length:156 start_codon:yes stop_codon:yes gene_type:complete
MKKVGNFLRDDLEAKCKRLLASARATLQSEAWIEFSFYFWGLVLVWLLLIW